VNRQRDLNRPFEKSFHENARPDPGPAPAIVESERGSHAASVFEHSAASHVEAA
jgi:hypothetical protein